MTKQQNTYSKIKIRLTNLFGLLMLSIVAMPVMAEVTYYHNDAQGSVVAATDEAGNVLWRESYQPFGKRIERQASTEDNIPFFTGKPHDDITGLSYFGARHYDPEIGRFLGIDPVGVDGANPHSFNRYAYANNNPYTYIDPDGRFTSLSALKKGTTLDQAVEEGRAVRAGGATAIGIVFVAGDGIDSASDIIVPIKGVVKGIIKKGSNDLVDAAGGVVKNAKKGDVHAPGGRDRAKELFRKFDTKGVGNRTIVRENDGSRAVVGELDNGTPLRIRFKKNGTTRIQAGKQKIQFND